MRTGLVVGIPVTNEPSGILRETFKAIAASSIQPFRVIAVHNGDDHVQDDMRAEWNRVMSGIGPRLDEVFIEGNIGCAGAWNLIHKIAGDRRTIIINADCAVAPDTFDRMLDSHAEVVCAYGFGCFTITKDVRDEIGDFDEKFWPVYWEDTDYRYRLKLADVDISEWPIDDHEDQSGLPRGRKRSESGIVHGHFDPDGYQGWRGGKLAWFQDRLAANEGYYRSKWGGGHTKEIYKIPFNGHRIT